MKVKAAVAAEHAPKPVAAEAHEFKAAEVVVEHECKEAAAEVVVEHECKEAAAEALEFREVAVGRGCRAAEERKAAHECKAEARPASKAAV